MISIFLELLSYMQYGHKITERRIQPRQWWAESGKLPLLISFKQTDEDEERQASYQVGEEAGDGLADNSCWEETFTLPL